MKISVVITTYNGSQYIREQLDSITGQTVKPDEIVLFDDCSSDNTRQLVESYVKEHNQFNWVVHFNQQNLGFRKNFYEALKASTGDFIFLADQDDIWMPEKFQEMRDVMKEHNEINLLAHTFSNMYPDGETERQDITTVPGNKVCRDREKALYQIVDTKNIVKIHLPGCSFCIRRSFFDLCSRYWIETCPHDAVLWRYASLTDSIYVIDHSLMLYRRHSTSTWQKELRADRKRSREKALQWRDAELNELYCIRQFAGKENISETYRKRIERNIGYVQLRRKFYNTRNPLFGLALAKYMDLYNGVKGWLRDWKVTYA